MDYLDRMRELQQAAERLGEWLARAADREGPIPGSIWRRISELATLVAAHAAALADGTSRAE